MARQSQTTNIYDRPHVCMFVPYNNESTNIHLNGTHIFEKKLTHNTQTINIYTYTNVFNDTLTTANTYTGHWAQACDDTTSNQQTFIQDAHVCDDTGANQRFTYVCDDTTANNKHLHKPHMFGTTQSQTTNNDRTKKLSQRHIHKPGNIFTNPVCFYRTQMYRRRDYTCQV